jgi:23S rRNA (cytosine1962-C5)-methyltransferase
MTSEPTLTLKPAREKSVVQRHPWIFSGAVAAVSGQPANGETVTVRAADGAFLARAAYNPQSQIVARIWTWDESETVDADFLARRIAQAIQRREAFAQTTNALRWVNAESDGLPGLIVDVYASFVVCQFLTAGAERWKREIAVTLAAQPNIVGVYERSDVEVRGKEGLQTSEGVLCGETPPDDVEVWEATGNLSLSKTLGNEERILRHREQRCQGASPLTWRFLVDLKHGHKTGFYLDQRHNRKVAHELARDREVLNCFAYTGAFTIAALSGSAHSVISIESSAQALDMARRNLALNQLPTDGLCEGDVFKLLRAYRDAGRTFDLIILDPPKFAQTQAQLNKATRAYKDINWLALRLLKPQGYLITFSCSGLVSAALFQKIVFGAALDAKRDAQVVRWLGQASDHPVRLSFPEGAYLKGLVCQVE